MPEEPSDNPARDEQVNQAIAAYLAAVRAGQSVTPQDWLARYPDLAAELATFFADKQHFEGMAAALPPLAPATLVRPATHLVCPHCHNAIELVHQATHEGVLCPTCGSSFRLEHGSTTAWAPRDGRRKLGRFELIDCVGMGAFGSVYKARDPELDRTVAIKVPRAGNLAGADDLDRFVREARSAAQLRHPSIVPIHEVGQEDGLPYLVSDFVEGTTLADWLTARRPGPRDAAQMIAAVADALQYAHERGVVHRDVKPSNVMLGDDGAPHLMDFGLAKREAGEITITIDGQVLGTPAYMSPEQARGEAHMVDGRSDVYSLGVILYQLLTGELPFRGNSRMLLHQVLHDEPRPPRCLNDRIPRDLETVCLKAMAKEPGRRYASAGALAEDLRHWLKGKPIVARPVSHPERLWRWCKRSPRVAGLLGAVAGLVVLWGITSSALALELKYQKERAERSAEDARKQEAIAKDNAEEAKKQEVLTKQNAERADNEARKANQYAETARTAVTQRTYLVGQLHRLLQNKRLVLATAPEVRRLREQMLTLLRESLVGLGKTTEATGTATYGQAAIATQLGDLLTQLGQDADAAPLYRQAYEQTKRLAEAGPDNDQARANLGVIAQRLGDSAWSADGDLRTAIARYAEARDLHRDILEHPRGGQGTALQSKIRLSHDDVRLGRAYLALGQPDEARKCFEEAVSCRRAWCDAEPKSVEARSWLTQAEWWLGIACSHLGDEKGVREHLGKALSTTEGLVKDYPKDASFKEDLSEIQGSWGDAMLRLNKPEEAAKSYEAALNNLQVAIDRNPDDMLRQPLLALAHERLGVVAARLRRPADAQKHYQEALKRRGELMEVEPRNLSWHAAYAVALARAGKPAEAAVEAAKVRPRAAKNADLLMQLARCYAACAAGDTPQNAEYVRRALEMAGAAVREGYKDVVALTTDPDFAALRGEAEFQKLIDRIKAR